MPIPCLSYFNTLCYHACPVHQPVTATGLLQDTFSRASGRAWQTLEWLAPPVPPDYWPRVSEAALTYNVLGAQLGTALMFSGHPALWALGIGINTAVLCYVNYKIYFNPYFL